MIITKKPKRIKKFEEENCTCYCGCLSGKGENEKLEEADINISHTLTKKV